MTIWQKLVAVFFFLAVVGLIGAGYYYYQYHRALQLSSTTNLQKSAQAEVKQLVSQVGKLMDLPQGEDPTVATITDISKLKDQPFFAQAQNGDKVLIYTNSKKAILFDPKADKIIDVAPVNIGSSSAQPTQARILLRNGTTVSELTSKTELAIQKAYPDANIVGKDKAATSTYTKTLVVYFNDGAKSAAQSLAQTLNASVSATLPAGEAKVSDADILVIIGKDQS